MMQKAKKQKQEQEQKQEPKPEGGFMMQKTRLGRDTEHIDRNRRSAHRCMGPGRRRAGRFLMAMALVLSIAAPVWADETEEAQEPQPIGKAQITVFAAKSLNTVLDECIIPAYNELQPNVKIIPSYDSSGTLMTQIEEGAQCDVFFSAAQKQMDELEKKGFVVDGTRRNIVNNQVCVVTYKDSGTKVTGLKNLADARSMALADGSVPVGKYTREALAALGMIAVPEDGDVSAVTTQETSEALGGLEINECANVGAVTAAVSEGANEVGTVYYSDTYGLEDRLVILEKVPYKLTGDVIYPAAQIVDEEADAAQKEAAEDFVEFLASDIAKDIFDSYYFDTNV